MRSAYTPSGTYATSVASPRVLRAVRKHFGCDSLEGAQLEDGGGAGTAVSHWEMRWFRDEYMTGSASPGERVFSTMTAALFADSGWYVVNASLSEPMPWGHDEGCDFVQKPCDEWKQRGYLCRGTYDTACSYDRMAKSYCDMRSYGKPLPYGMRHFTDAYQGGFSELLDYCPVYRAYEDGACKQPGYNSFDSNNWEERCESCRCFDSTASDEPWRTGSGTACHRMRCLNSTALEIRLGNKWRSCPTDGGEIPLSPIHDGHGGAVKCPPAHELCPVDGTLWPQLWDLSPHSGSYLGGMTLTLTGVRLSSLHPPILLTFGTAEGAEFIAADLNVLNDTHATATVPPYLDATSFARADISLTDAAGRAAYLFDAFVYEPSAESYFVTLAMLLAVLLLACYVVPKFVRRGCETSPHLFEWQTAPVGEDEKPPNGQRGPTGEQAPKEELV